jgi:hypothetical protein
MAEPDATPATGSAPPDSSDPADPPDPPDPADPAAGAPATTSCAADPGVGNRSSVAKVNPPTRRAAKAARRRAALVEKMGKS